MCIWRSGGPKSIGKHIVPESARRYFPGKMYIWRSGGPKSMGKHIVPESPPHDFPGNIAIFCIFENNHFTMKKPYFAAKLMNQF
jgi:hypothetical protein